MIGAMKAALLGVALLLMFTAIVSSLLVEKPRLPFPHPFARLYVSGRVTGDFPDHPWAGSTVYFGNDKRKLGEDGTFSFPSAPGKHVLKVCCSERFRWIYREVTVVDRDVEVNLTAEPLVAVPGKVVMLGKGTKLSGYRVTAWLVGTNIVEAAITLSDGSFALHLIEGTWEVDVDKLPEGLGLESVIVGENKADDRRFKLSSLDSRALPLRIELR